MSLYLARGLSCAVYTAQALPLVVEALGTLMILKEPKSRIPDNPATAYVTDVAKQMNLNKKFIVTQRLKYPRYFAWGTTFLPGIARISGPSSVTDLNNIDRFRLARFVVRIKANEVVTWGSIPIIAAIVTHFIVNAISPMGGCIGGPAVGMLVGCVMNRLRKRVTDLTAMKYCLNEVNQAYLEFLQKTKVTGGSRKLCFIGRTIRRLAEPSLDEKIQYFDAYIRTQKTT